MKKALHIDMFKEDVVCAHIAHLFSPAGSWEHIFAQNYLLERGHCDLVNINNENRTNKSETDNG